MGADFDGDAVFRQRGKEIFVGSVVAHGDDKFPRRGDDRREDGREYDAFVDAVLPDFDDAVAGHDLDGQPVYNIKAVVEATGLPAATLRAWERRYGVPTPERTSSGYRLYGAGEVEQVRRMRRLCEEGMAASEAARIVLAGPAKPADPQADPYAAAVDAILEAVERFDDVSLDLQLRRVMFLGPSGALVGLTEKRHSAGAPAKKPCACFLLTLKWWS